MTVLSFLKAVLGFLGGAGFGIGVALLGLYLYFNRQPPATGQIGDIGLFAVNLVGSFLVIGFLTLLGGVAGIVMMARFR